MLHVQDKNQLNHICVYVYMYMYMYYVLHMYVYMYYTYSKMCKKVNLEIINTTISFSALLSCLKYDAKKLKYTQTI